MAFIASTLNQANALQNAQQQALWIKGVCQSAVTTLQAGNVTSDQVFQLVDNIRAALSMLNSDASVPGIAAYAQAQFSNTNYDIATEFTTMVNDLNAVISWVVANFPKDAGGFIEGWTLNSDGSRTAATFTPTQTAGLVTALNAVIAQIA